MANNLYIKAKASTVSTTIGANLIQTGQTTSYRTGDDITRGRLTSFLVLASNNPWGNTNRFTDTLGTQTYANGIVIDWSTYDSSKVLLYYIGDSATFRTWNVSIDLKLSTTIGGLTGWYLWNIREVINVCDFSKKPYRMNYAPFNFGSGSRYFHISTDYDGTNAFVSDLGGTVLITAAKTNSYFGVYCRYATVTGTTLS
jgi:hypothetical protein